MKNTRRLIFFEYRRNQFAVRDIFFHKLIIRIAASSIKESGLTVRERFAWVPIGPCPISFRRSYLCCIMLAKFERSVSEFSHGTYPLSRGKSLSSDQSELTPADENIMKIIFLTISLDLGGSERRAITLAKYFKQRGAEVELWGFNNPGVLSQICDEVHIPWKVVPFSWYQSSGKRLANLFQLLRMLKKANPDILLPHTLIPNMACGLVWRWTGAQKCIGYEGGYEFGLVNRNWEELAAKQLSSIICNAHHLARAMVSYYALEQKKVKIIPNGVELPQPVHSRAWWRAKLDVNQDTFLAVMLANLSGFKDHEVLIRAWRLVLDQLFESEGNAKLLLAGKNFGTEPNLKRLVSELKLEADVLFLGQVKDVSGLLQSVDLGVYSSKSEGSPNGVLECMQAGLAIAATDFKGIREVLGEAQYPWLASLDDANQFAQNILILKRDLMLRKKIGSYNRNRVMKEYSPEQMCKTTEALITG